MKNCCYTVIAKNALMNWNGLTEEEAQRQIANSTFDELEGQVWATSSIHSAVMGVCSFVGREDLAPAVEAVMLGKDEGQYETEMAELRQALQGVNKNDLAIYCLQVIHDGWVVGNSSKFNKEGREGKRYQHLPLEMIGWKEAKADLLFLQPVMEACMDDPTAVNTVALHAKYDETVKAFFQQNGFLDKKGKVDKAQVASAVMRGAEFYPALTDANTAKTEEVANAIAEQVTEKVAPSLENVRTIK